MYLDVRTERILEQNRKLKMKVALYESSDPVQEIKELCDRQVKAANEREERSHENWMRSVASNKELKKKNTELRKERDGYKSRARTAEIRSEMFEKRWKGSQGTIAKLEGERDELKKSIETKNQTIQDKERQIEALKEELCRLKAEKEHDGTTNGIPTSQTPINKKKVIPNTRPKTNRSSGGQAGHKKRRLGSFREDEISDVETHPLERCPACGGKLEEMAESIDKDEGDYEVIIRRKRHRFPKYRCRECGKEVHAEIPRRIKEENQYGPGLQATILALQTVGFVSLQRIREIVCGILGNGLKPSEGYIGKMQKRAAGMLTVFYESVRKHCLEQRVLHWDDTVIFVNTARACFRFYGNKSIAFYAAHGAKDAKGLEEDGILANLKETTHLMHDHVRYNYRKEFLFKNIECVQHLQRELQKVYNDSGHTWAKEMKEQIAAVIHQRKEYLKRGINSFTEEETSCFEEKMEQLIRKAYREYNENPGRYYSNDEKNAIKKIVEYRENYFAWVYDFSLPTTNNIAESGLRMTKTKMKVSGQFTKIRTAQEFAIVRTYTETCRRNGVDEFQALKRLMAGSPYSLEEVLSSTTD